MPVQIKIISVSPHFDPNHFGIHFVWLTPRSMPKERPGDAIYSAQENKLVFLHGAGPRGTEFEEMLIAEARKWLGTGAEKRPFCFLKIDIVGHSTISRRNPQIETDETWDAFDNYVSKHVTAKGGEVWVWQGDGGLCAFSGNESEKRAVSCGREIILGLDKFNGNLNRIQDVTIQVRVAVHTGWAIPKGDRGRIHSRDINLVAHLEAARTCPNSISISEDTFTQLPKDIRSEFHLFDELYEDKKIYTNATLDEFKAYILKRQASNEELQREVDQLRTQVELLKKGHIIGDDSQMLQDFLAEVDENLAKMEDVTHHNSVPLNDTVWNIYKGKLTSLNRDLQDLLKSAYPETAKINHYASAWVTSMGSIHNPVTPSIEQSLRDAREKLKPSLERIKNEIEKHLQPSEPWEYIPWKENFIAWAGPLDGLVDREDVVPESSFIEELNRRGYTTSYQYQGSSLLKALDSGFRIVYLTDKKSWKRKYALENSPLTIKRNLQS